MIWGTSRNCPLTPVEWGLRRLEWLLSNKESHTVLEDRISPETTGALTIPQDTVGSYSRFAVDSACLAS